jgi:protein O-GlcNAc transferase
VAYLPETFFPTDAATGTVGKTTSRTEQGLPENAFVFCSFNNSYKFNAEVFAVWMRLLAQLDDSVLWLPQHRPKVRENLCREAARHGISKERLVFAKFTDTHAEHLARLRVADLFLDTLPYNAHTTAADALRAGLPILTCLGGSFAARVAGSLLSAVGIPDLITKDLEEYEGQALRLARDRALLARLRATLETNLNVQPLFNTARYTRHLEAAYRTMHQRSLQGVAPSVICVPKCDS